MGIACFEVSTSHWCKIVSLIYSQLGQLDEAEDALCEANILNNLDPIVWAYISLLCKAVSKLLFMLSNISSFTLVLL